MQHVRSQDVVRSLFLLLLANVAEVHNNQFLSLFFPFLLQPRRRLRAAIERGLRGRFLWTFLGFVHSIVIFFAPHLSMPLCRDGRGFCRSTGLKY